MHALSVFVMPDGYDFLSGHVVAAAIPLIWFLNYLNLLEWRFKKLVHIRREIDRLHFPPGWERTHIAPGNLPNASSCSIRERGLTTTGSETCIL